MVWSGRIHIVRRALDRRCRVGVDPRVKLEPHRAVHFSHVDRSRRHHADRDRVWSDLGKRAQRVLGRHVVPVDRHPAAADDAARDRGGGLWLDRLRRCGHGVAQRGLQLRELPPRDLVLDSAVARSVLYRLGAAPWPARRRVPVRPPTQPVGWGRGDAGRDGHLDLVVL